jgi:hypothetical protein
MRKNYNSDNNYVFYVYLVQVYDCFNADQAWLSECLTSDANLLRRSIRNMAMVDSDILFRPLQVGALELPHRVVMAPLTRARATRRVPNDLMAEYYQLPEGLAAASWTHENARFAHQFLRSA